MNSKSLSIFLLVAFVLVSPALMLYIARGSSPGNTATNASFDGILKQGLLVKPVATSTAFSSTAFTNTLYLPLVIRPPGTLYGQVFENGVPTIGITVALAFCKYYAGPDPSVNLFCADYQYFYTVTDETGTYRFIDMPTLVNAGPYMVPQTYHVLWVNPNNDPNRLSSWQTRMLDSYTAGDWVNIGDFDIGGILLLSPPNGSVVPFPVEFQWRRRASVSSDSYSPCIWGSFLPSPANIPLTPPYSVRCNEPLGYVDSFVLEYTHSFQTEHYWVVQIYGPTGGKGKTHRNAITFIWDEP